MDTPRVPPELILAILARLDRPELFALRAANKTFHGLVTPMAFHQVTVSDALVSAERFTALQSTRELAVHVQSVVFRGRSEHGPVDDPRLTCVSQAMEGLSKLPNLASLKFEFHDIWDEDVWSFADEPAYWLMLQRAVLEAISNTSRLPKLKSLTLNNLITMPGAIFASEAFVAFLRPLETLSIATLGNGASSAEPIVEFWKQLSRVLAAAQLKSVSTLRILSDHLIGVNPEFILPKSPIPRLTSLHLKSICSQNDGVERFILRHPGLRSLTLEDCSMFIEDDQYVRPWAVVFASLDAGLESLVQVDVDSGTLRYRDRYADYVELDGSADRRALREWEVKLQG
ncbi:hypothetical protein FB45DRAFT_1087092 [Roridomyces roridus]|uniref:F-box domain-containing protein n=1 Tax=Roridomyces roridus TaxID=1738132 RepID=A0AAD7FI10_9AGAR|nr:hypothetical protein FB45DRAFT_1087092 [Roridomyces roridus]